MVGGGNTIEQEGNYPLNHHQNWRRREKNKGKKKEKSQK